MTTDITVRLRATLLDKDNFPRMKQEKWLPIGLAEEAAAEIERLRAALEKIAYCDHRGNRTTCQVWAREALNVNEDKTTYGEELKKSVAGCGDFG